jgi:hypothetical protein
MSHRALEFAPAGTPEQARLLARYGWDIGVADGGYEPAHEALQEAAALARRLGDSSLEARALGRFAAVAGQHLRNEECLELAGRCRDLATTGVVVDGDGLWWGSVAAATLGDVSTARAFSGLLTEQAERLRRPAQLASARVRHAIIELSVGNWSAGAADLDPVLDLAGFMPAASEAAVMHAQLGDVTMARGLMARVAADPVLPIVALFAVRLALCSLVGVSEEHAARYVKGIGTRVLERARNPRSALGARLALALHALAQGDSASAEQHYAGLAVHAGVFFDCVAVDRVLGLVAGAAGETEAAARHYEAAIAFCHRAGYQPELAWSLYGLGQLTASSTDHATQARSAQALEESLNVARDLTMRPLIERVLAMRSILRA